MDNFSRGPTAQCCSQSFGNFKLLATLRSCSAYIVPLTWEGMDMSSIFFASVMVGVKSLCSTRQASSCYSSTGGISAMCCLLLSLEQLL